MSGIISANPTVQRREERLLARARMDAIDAKLDRLVEVVTPTPPQDPRVITLARAMGHKDYHLPTGSIASLTFDDDNEIIATGLTIEAGSGVSRTL
jgi:hypothetical protein